MWFCKDFLKIIYTAKEGKYGNFKNNQQISKTYNIQGTFTRNRINIRIVLYAVHL